MTISSELNQNGDVTPDSNERSSTKHPLCTDLDQGLAESLGTSIVPLFLLMSKCEENVYSFA